MGVIQETAVIIHTALNKLCGFLWCRKSCEKYGLAGNSHPAINVEMLRDQASFWIKKQNKTKQTWEKGGKKERQKQQPSKDKIMEGWKLSWDEYIAKMLDIEAC